MDPTRRLPDHLVEHARQFADGSREPAATRDASTVVLVREAGEGEHLEVYLLRRSTRMDFAGGFCVFPGGGVDPRDADRDVAWAGPAPAEWAALLGCDEDRARALVCAAVRETFEESGVLLAGETDDSVVSDTTGASWESDRRRLEGRELAFADFLTGRGLVLRTDLLAFWGSWVTPVFEPKRYDTRFFLAGVPEGQATRDVSQESDHASWLAVSEAITAVDEGRLAMLPPTYATCLELVGARSVAAVMAAAEQRDRSPIEPEMKYDDDGAYLELPRRLVELGKRVAAGETR